METYKSLFINSAIPAVQNKFLRHRSQKIIVQLKNVSFQNIAVHDEILAAFNEAPEVKFVFQFSNCRDFSLLSLCLSSSI